ncbi:MAG: CopG family transcriptional regulator [Acidobacteria bacterium]|nr:MAG: CopG family transcriptional regulator [Acidobacteriota bacterium]
MPNRNITLALPEQLIREARLLAAEEDTSISAIVAGLLQAQVRRRRGFTAARRRHSERLKHAPDLGTGGRATWRRDDLHER